MNTIQKFELGFPFYISSFMKSIGSNEIEIYNEFSLQHELGILLRSQMLSGWKAQFERNISYFGMSTQNSLKREIDIVVYNSTREFRIAFELKYPTNGQYPEQMFKCCQDICFLEQLVEKGFAAGYFLIVADDHNFYEGDIPSPIYSFFRTGKTIHGQIQKPTGDKGASILINGNYKIDWVTASPNFKYALIEVK